MSFWKRSFLAFISLFLLASPTRAEDNAASWLRTQTANALNPNISVIADFLGVAGPRSDAESNRFSVRETEFGFQTAVDPYARADFFLGLHEGETPELEEGYVTLLALPGGFQARGGKILANFGRLNMVHSHELPQVDRPLVLSRFLGEEGLNDTGVEISRIVAPLGLFTEISYGILNGLGAEHGHGDDENAETVFINAADENGNIIVDANGNPVRLPVSVHAEEEDETPRTLRNFAHVARVRFYKDLTDSANLELGVSGALHQPEGHEQRRLGGMDMTFRWKPLRQGTYRSFVWRTEALSSNRVLEAETDLTGAVVSPKRRLDRRGVYSYVEFQPARRWRFGLRGDYTEDPEAKDEIFTLDDGSTRQVKKSITRSASPYVGFALSEFSRFRAQYTNAHLPNGEDEHRGFLQWTIVLGPHGAHPF